MLSAIVSVRDARVYQRIFITIEGHIPKILFEYRLLVLSGKLFRRGFAMNRSMIKNFTESVMSNFPLSKICLSMKY